MKGMGQIVTWSVRDETLHCLSMIRLFNTFIHEHPEIWDDQMKEDLYDCAKITIKHEDAFIDLAKTAKNKQVREKAIFWLGQLAGKKALETLTDIVFDEEKTELQEKAVFALSQLDNGEGIPKLIKAAKEHPNPQIRKKAIFWLGESGDQRALEALIEMVQK